ncbi:hypothetical protein ACTFIU_011187 [Dictyostelium citrinum]
MISLFPSYDYVLTTDASESGGTLKKGSRIIDTWLSMLAMSEFQQKWSNPGSISLLRTASEAVSQEESQLDWRAHIRIQCQSRPPQPSFRVQSQVEDGQELQLATQEGSF